MCSLLRFAFAFAAFRTLRSALLACAIRRAAGRSGCATIGRGACIFAARGAGRLASFLTLLRAAILLRAFVALLRAALLWTGWRICRAVRRRAGLAGLCACLARGLGA